MFVVLPQEFDCSPEPISSTFNRVEYVLIIYAASNQFIVALSSTSVHVEVSESSTSRHEYIAGVPSSVVNKSPVGVATELTDRLGVPRDMDIDCPTGSTVAVADTTGVPSADVTA